MDNGGGRMAESRRYVRGGEGKGRERAESDHRVDAEESPAGVVCVDPCSFSSSFPSRTPVNPAHPYPADADCRAFVVKMWRIFGSLRRLFLSFLCCRLVVSSSRFLWLTRSWSRYVALSLSSALLLPSHTDTTNREGKRQEKREKGRQKAKEGKNLKCTNRTRTEYWTSSRKGESKSKRRKA